RRLGEGRKNHGDAHIRTLRRPLPRRHIGAAFCTVPALIQHISSTPPSQNPHNRRAGRLSAQTNSLLLPETAGSNKLRNAVCLSRFVLIRLTRRVVGDHWQGGVAVVEHGLVFPAVARV